MTYSCKECGAVLKTEKIAALGHDMQQPSVTKAATCTETGTSTSKCSRCSETVTETIAALGHDFSEPVIVPATCTKAGSRTGKCNRCNETTAETIEAKGHSYVYAKDNTQHWQKCSVCNDETDKADHTLTETGTGATCTAPGEKTSSCALCGYEKKETENALGHDMKNVSAKAANCTELGWDAYTECSRCGVKEGYLETQALGHDMQDVEAKAATCTEAGYNAHRACSRCEEKSADYKETKAPGHQLAEYSKKEATCTEDGYEAYEKCANCDYTTYKKIDKLNHDFENGTEISSVKATCTTQGSVTRKCSRCSETQTTSIPVDTVNGHSYSTAYSSDITKHWYACTNAGCTSKKDEAAHTEGKTTNTATCDKAGVKTTYCLICNGVMKTENAAATGHTYETVWTSDDTYHWHKATCGHTTAEGDKAEHTWDTGVVTTVPTCTTTGVKTFTCSVCKGTKTETIPAGHTYDETKWEKNDNQHWHVCTSCNEADTKTDHSWGDGVETQAATTESTGIRTYTCSVCKGTKTEVIPKIEYTYKDDSGHWLKTGSESDKVSHTYGEYTVTKAATCSEAGSRSRTCTVCGYKKTETIAKLEHDYSTEWAYTDGTGHYHKCRNCTATKDTAEHVLAETATTATCTQNGTKTLTCVCGYSTTAADPKKAHTPVEVTDDKYLKSAATCTAPAYFYKSCSVCKAKLEEEKVFTSASYPILGHAYVSHEAKAPTCTEIGWDAYDTCSRCDYTTYVEKAALGHDYVEHKAQAATCTAYGWSTYNTCSRCDYTTYVEKAALGHDYVEHKAQAATCTAYGWSTYNTCSRCDYTELEAHKIAATGHSYETIAAVAATCTKEGHSEYKQCSKCLDKTSYSVIPVAAHTYVYITTDAVKHWKECSVCGVKEANSEAEHVWDEGTLSYWSTPPCNATRTYTCEICKKTKEENVYKLHEYENYKCKRCGEWGKGPSGGYVFYDCDEDNVTENGVVKAGPDGLISSECGWRFLEAAPSDIKNGSGESELFFFGYYIPDGAGTHQPVGTTKDGIGEGRTNTEDLVFAMGINGENAWTDSTAAATKTEEYAALLCYNYTCSNSDTEENFADWFLPSIEELKLIMANLNKAGLGNLECNFKYYWSSSEVDSSTDSTDRVKVVYTKGYKSDVEETCQYKNDNSAHKCYIRPIRAFSLCSDGTPNHTWSEDVTTTPATCTAKGQNTYTCTKCTAKKTEGIAPLEHSWDEGVVTTQASCVDGVRIRTCYSCSKKKTESIPAGDHYYENYKCIGCNIWGKGPSGGYVFYDCDEDNVTENGVVTAGPDGLISSECGWRFLEVAPEDAEVNVNGESTATIIFGLYAKELETALSKAGTSTGIGTGLKNTEALVKAMGRSAIDNQNFYGPNATAGTTENYAAKVALDYSVTTESGVTYDDWFLPSKDELLLVFTNLLKDKVNYHYLDSTLDQGRCWTSSEAETGSPSNSMAYDVDPYRSISCESIVRDAACGVRPIRAFSLCKDGKSEHKWTAMSTKQATCTENGSKTYKCSVCSATKTETLVALGHEYVNYKCKHCQQWGRGPAGGWVFYDAGSDQTATYTDRNGKTQTYTWRYLEAAPEDLSYTKDGTTYYEYAFGYYRENATINPTYGSGDNLLVDGTGYAIGTGRNNTGLLMSKMAGSSNYAYVSLPSGTTQYVKGAYAAGATYCNINGTIYSVENQRTSKSYSDWFLPSRDELLEMHKVLHKNGLGNFTDGADYWSSKEIDAAKALCKKFGSDTTNNVARSTKCRVRAIRAFTDTVTSSST